MVSVRILHKKVFQKGNCIKKVNGGSHFENPPFFQAVILQPHSFLSKGGGDKNAQIVTVDLVKLLQWQRILPAAHFDGVAGLPE